MFCIDSICIIAAEWSKKIRVTRKSNKLYILITNLIVKREEIWEISWHRFLLSWKFLGWRHNKLCYNLPWVILTHAMGHIDPYLSWWNLILYFFLETVQMCPQLCDCYQNESFMQNFSLKKQCVCTLQVKLHAVQCFDTSMLVLMWCDEWDQVWKAILWGNEILTCLVMTRWLLYICNSKQ